MTSLVSLILKLTSLTRQSQFYLSQYLGALIHLPHAWRNFHADLHLTSLTLRVIQLSLQLRLDSLIRIGAPPLLKLTSQPARLSTEGEAEMNDAVLPLNLPKLQKPLNKLQETILNAPDPLQAITRTFFQTRPGSQQPLNSSRISTTSKPDMNTFIPASTPQPLPSSARLTGETPAEESLRENVVETWLKQQDETGRRPMISFVEAHKLYRDLYEEFVSTAILPPNRFASNFLQTPPTLTLDQAKSDLRTRLNTGFAQEYSRTILKTQPGTETPSPSLLAPSYIAATLWAKGSLAFGVTPQSPPPSLLRVVPSGLEGNATRSSLISEGKQSNLDSNGPNQMEASFHQPGPSVTGIPTLNLPGEREMLDRGRNPLTGLAPEGSDLETRLPNTSLDRSEFNQRMFSPATALYSALAAHTTTAFISPRKGNGHTSPQTIHTSSLKPPFALERNLTTVTFTDSRPKIAQDEEPVIERLERILPIGESHPTPIYLRPPMNLPAVASTTQQRNLVSTLPSSSIASTRENISRQDLGEEDEDSDKNGESEGYPEIEDDSEDAAMREQVKRMGKIIAEEARRHIGST